MMKFLRNVILVCFLASSSAAYAQMPDTDIWLFDIAKKGDSISFTNPVNITNRTGYDNQPAFSPDGRQVVYSSYRENGQSDIYSYDIASHTNSAFCKTPESEYSPAFTPDGKYISVVRVGKDSSQRLFKFPVKGGDAVPVFTRYKMDSIAYYCWKDSTDLLLLLIGTPERLIFTNTKNIDPLIIAINSVGRTMMTDNQEINYIVSRTDSVWSICKLSYQPTGIGIQFQVKCLKGVEDFAIYNDEVFICGKGSFLYTYDYSHPYKESEYEVQWTKNINLASYGLKDISRVAVSKDGKRIAVVSSR